MGGNAALELTSFKKRAWPFVEAIRDRSASRMRTHFMLPSSLLHALRNRSEGPVLMVGAANALLEGRLYDLASPYFAFALRLQTEPNSFEATLLRANLAVVHLRLGDVDAAFAFHTSVLDIAESRIAEPRFHSLFVEALYHKGRIHSSKGEDRQARRTFERGLAVTDSDNKGRFLHEIATLSLTGGRYDEATAFFEDADRAKIPLASSNLRSSLATKLMLGRALLTGGHRTRGLAILEQIVNCELEVPRHDDSSDASPSFLDLGPPAEDLRLLAARDLAGCAFESGNDAAIKKWVAAGAAIQPQSDDGRRAALELEMIRAVTLVPSADQRRALGALEKRLREDGIPTYAADLFAEIHFGILSSYVSEGDSRGAATHAKELLPIFSQLAHDGLIRPEQTELLRSAADFVEDLHGGSSQRFREARFRFVFGERIWIDGDWAPEALRRDMAIAEDTIKNRLAAVRKAYPSLPELDVAIVHHDEHVRGTVGRYRALRLIAIRSGAIIRVGKTLDSVLRSAGVLKRWNLEMNGEASEAGTSEALS